MNRKIIIKEFRANKTEAEKLLWEQLRNRNFLNIKFRRQVSIENYIVDFVSFEKKLVIELDGEHHNNEDRKRYDKERTKILENNGYKVIRFWNNDILKNMGFVLNAINLTLSPSPLAGEGNKLK